ncbi:VTT domain-containing protein [Patescibacteria group bacterium]|nr:VTT domain-containing protein [Patescibacteria group bacterium]
MFRILDKTKNLLKEWSDKHSQGKHAKFWLLVFSFTEASFFVIPPDVFLLAILINNGPRWIYYAWITTVASVLGGLLGYVFGFFFFDLVGEFLINTYNLQSQMATVSNLFQDNAFWAVFVSAFTPIPFKVFTISAGFFHINIITFFVASLIGRGLRFFAVGYLVKLFGKQMAHYAFKYFNYITLLILALILALLFT